MRQEPGPPGVDSAGPRQPALAYLPAVVALGLALLAGHYVSTGGLWDDNLSSLSPVPDSRLQTDGLLRSAAGTPDMRYQLVLSATSLETLLLESESVDRLLEDAVKDGLLDGWQSVSQVLPSQQLQQLRQAAIPDSGTLRNRLNTVLAGSPFRREAFTPFEANSRAAKSLAPLMPSHFRNTSLASWLNLHLVELQGQWISLVSLSRPRPAELAERVATWGKDAELVDIQQSSGSLLRDYRNGATRTIAIASLIIVVLLVLQIRKVRTTLWIALTVAAALAVTIALITILHGKLNVIHLVALLLVLGLGLDYSLFLSRSESATERRVTQQAVLVCAVSTGVAFGVLAGSSIPVLKFLGFTVAIGSIASVSLAFLGSLSRRGKVG